MHAQEIKLDQTKPSGYTKRRIHNSFFSTTHCRLLILMIRILMACWILTNSSIFTKAYLQGEKSTFYYWSKDWIRCIKFWNWLNVRMMVTTSSNNGFHARIWVYMYQPCVYIVYFINTDVKVISRLVWISYRKVFPDEFIDFDFLGAWRNTQYIIFFFSVHRYGNSKEHMTVAELKMFLETEQKVNKLYFSPPPCFIMDIYLP